MARPTQSERIPRAGPAPPAKGRSRPGLGSAAAHPEPGQRAPRHPTQASPGSQGAAQHMLHVPIAASGERIHAPTKLPRHLRTRGPSASMATQGPAHRGQRDSWGSSWVGQGQRSGSPTQVTPACPCRELWNSRAPSHWWLQWQSSTPYPTWVRWTRASPTYTGHLSECPCSLALTPQGPGAGLTLSASETPIPVTARPHPGSAPAHW